MKLITKEIEKQLLYNHKNTDFGTESIAKKPVVVKYFNPMGVGDWWAYSMDNNGYMFGIADIFTPEYGDFHIDELKENGIERDMYYTPETFEEVIIKRKRRQAYG
tara:strand:+ start:341 stop:655 length:315 start_codon:yes stop_codon:yes gene_type:complete